MVNRKRGMLKDNSERNGSAVDPIYGGGDYFADPQRHSEDARFKASCFLKLFVPLIQRYGWDIHSYVDVGCGSGDLVRLVSGELREAGSTLDVVKGYDVSAHVAKLQAETIEYVHADFAHSDQHVDLVTLFDVFEHVVSPIDFLKNIASRSSVVALHIPLDNSVNNALRDKFRKLLRQPGHLLFMDSADALNICNLAGLRVITYEYTFGFIAPSGHRSLLAKIAYPIRLLMSRVSPWLMSKTVGGASLLVIALTPIGVRNKRWNACVLPGNVSGSGY